jgi:hypothetical protein
MSNIIQSLIFSYLADKMLEPWLSIEGRAALLNVVVANLAEAVDHNC